MPDPQESFTPPGVSSADLLSVWRNLVQAVNGLGQTYLQVQGLANRPLIAAATLVKAGAGRIATVSVTTAGSTTGTVYDAGLASATTNLIYVIPEALGVYVVNLPLGIGLVVVPGMGQVLTVSYS